MGRKFNDQSGRKFGRLFVLTKTVVIGQRKHICICDCGNKTFASPSDLLTGKKRSCGCLAKELTSQRSTTHGATRNGRENTPPEYKIWASMKARCKTHPRYSGRGIKVCNRWALSFSDFLEDMGPRPSSLHSIERQNNNKGYNKQNCIWATDKDQARNRRTNLMVEHAGRVMPLAEACELTGFNYDAAKYRVYAGKPFNQVRNRNAQDFGK